MTLFYQILGLTLTLSLMFFLIRGVTAMYIEKVLTKRQRKKLAKDQSFYEWFFYKRYSDVLPKSRLIWYYSNIIVYFILVIVVIILTLIDMQEIGKHFIWLYFYVNAALLIFSRISLKF